MSKTSSTFACFSNAAEPEEEVDNSILKSTTKITVEELLKSLQKMVEENPESAKATVFYTYDGSLEKTRIISLVGNKLLIIG